MEFSFVNIDNVEESQIKNLQNKPNDQSKKEDSDSDDYDYEIISEQTEEKIKKSTMQHKVGTEKQQLPCLQDMQDLDISIIRGASYLQKNQQQIILPINLSKISEVTQKSMMETNYSTISSCLTSKLSNNQINDLNILSIQEESQLFENIKDILLNQNNQRQNNQKFQKCIQEIQYLCKYNYQVQLNRKTFECLICINKIEILEQMIQLQECNHVFCKDCLLEYIQMNIQNNKYKYEDMICPQEGCNQLINILTIDNLLKENKPLYDRMIEQQFKNNQQNKSGIYFTCPGYLMKNKKTKEESLIEQETITNIRLGIPSQLPDDVEFIPCPLKLSHNNVEFKCTNCQYKSCLNGCEDYHYQGNKRGRNCEEFQKWKQNQQQFNKEILGKDTCQCPKCMQVYQRAGGCYHMKCNCGFEFCFVCQREWKCFRHIFYVNQYLN